MLIVAYCRAVTVMKFNQTRSRCISAIQMFSIQYNVLHFSKLPDMRFADYHLPRWKSAFDKSQISGKCRYYLLKNIFLNGQRWTCCPLCLSVAAVFIDWQGRLYGAHLYSQWRTGRKYRSTFPCEKPLIHFKCLRLKTL